MTKCFLDSNILVFLQNTDAPNHQQTKNLLLSLEKGNILFFISPLCLDEFIHEIGKLILQKFGQKRFYENLEIAMNKILELPNLSVVSTPADIHSQKMVISLMKDYHLRPRDAYHLLTMQANNIDGFATFDTDFSKVFAAKLLQKALA